MLSALPFFNLDNCEFLAALHDFEPVSDQPKLLKDILSDLGDKKFYDYLKTENFSLSDFNHSFSGQKHDLRCFHINIQSLNSKLDEFLHLINSLDVSFDIICLSEILSTNIPFFSCILADYEFNFDLPKAGIVGGVGLFTHKSLKIKLRTDLYINSSSNNKIENIWMEVSKSNKKFIIGCLYRHPNSFISDFCQLIETPLCKINKCKYPCILLGDINVDMLKFSASPAVCDYIDCLISNNFLPTLLFPTRVKRSSSTLIDHISFFDPELNAKNKIHSGSIICDISDHYPNFFLINIEKYIDMSKRPYIRVFSPNNKLKFNDKLNSVDWNEVFTDSDDVNICYDAFADKLSETHNSCFPLVRISRKAFKNKSWYNPELRSMLYEKNRSYNNWLKTSDDKDKLLYILNKKLYQTKCKNTKINYYKNLLNIKTSTSKKIWETLNSFMGNKSNSHKSNDIEKLLYSNTIYDNKLDIANIFNQYFVNVGAALANNLPPALVDFRSFLGPSNQNSIFLEQISTEEVCKVIKSMAGGTAAGDDGFNLELVKLNATILAQPLTYIYNLSLYTGIVPKRLKIAKVIPLFKKDDEKLPSNYRPISLLSVFNKIIEKLISKRLYNFFDHENIFYKYQFGFRKKHNTSLAVLEVTDFCYENLDNNKYVLGLFIDIQKAFDAIDIDILLVKLYHYGIRGVMFEWIRNYLHDRSQYTCVNGVKSSVNNITYGVPQGSVLGPLLFLIYVNDIQRATSVAVPKMFADDTNVFIVADNLTDLACKANTCLAELNQWCLANKLSINLGKTNYTIYSPKKKIITENISLNIGHIQIKNTACCKYLGMLIDHNLDWQEHINYIYKKLLKFCGIFYKIRDLLPFPCLKMLYFSFVYTHLAYGIEIYANTCNSYLYRLSILNNKIIRILFNKQTRTHVKDLYLLIDSLPILNLHEFFILKFVHKCLFNPIMLPPIFADYFSLSKFASRYNSRRQNDLYINQSNSNFGIKCLKTKACILWNKLPNDVKSIPDIFLFCKTVKKYLIDPRDDD